MSPIRTQSERFYLQPTTYSPNSPLPVLLYRNVLPRPHSASTTIEFLERNKKWEKRGIFGHHPTPHFHPNTHECYGIFQGSSTLRIGRGKYDSHSSGILVPVTAGDVIVIPAGITHSCVESFDDYHYVGVYPKNAPHWRNEFGKCPIDLAAMRKMTAAVGMPETDPVYGTEGPLMYFWPMATVQAPKRLMKTGAEPLERL
ncbi:hypothetical protein ACJ72_03526 [Emergomyces africanus]|uniref:Cupin type-1 domain-containing protein n=1 Tax=Emergomyces africanus TaxID=1955775 RepID=A0A1B7NZB4_9EURO|nr:hypothetical protein ACJ72_03526 [Emergomyces africanus]